MSDEKEPKPKFHFTMSGITCGDGSENFTIQFNAHENMTEEQTIEKIDQAKRLFDHVWRASNKKALAVGEAVKQKALQERQELPERFN